MVPKVFLVACVALANHATSQQVWKVDHAGTPGSHFVDLPPAVAAASAGDTILVYSGPSGGAHYYTAPTVDKGISIVGFAVGTSPGTNTPTLAGILGSLTIENVPAGERVVISNLLTVHNTLLPPFGSGAATLTIRDCQGSVVLEDYRYEHWGTAGQILEIERCDHVVFRGCDIFYGGAPLHVVDSNLLISNSVFQPVAVGGSNPYTTTTEALSLVRSQVTLSGSLVFGAGPLYLQVASAAATLDDSILRVSASSRLRGGQHPFPPPFPNPWDYAAAFDVVGPAPSIVEKDPRAPVFNFVQPPVITEVHETFHDWVVADEDYRVRVIGPPGGSALLAVGDMIQPMPSPLGDLGLDPTTAIVVDVVSLPNPDGVHTWTFHCPAWIPNGYAWAYQSLTVSPGGALGLTVPSPLVVAWDKDAIP